MDDETEAPVDQVEPEAEDDAEAVAVWTKDQRCVGTADVA
jgi:hypothetical protein